MKLIYRVLIVGTIITLSACGSSRHQCDAYSDVDTDTTNKEVSQAI